MSRLQKIRQLAIDDPEQIQICWDKLDSDPKYREEFEEVVWNSLGLMPMLEEKHTELTKHISDLRIELCITNLQINIAAAFTNVEYGEAEDTLELIKEYEKEKDKVEQELYAGYQMALMWYKYEKVKEIVGA